MCDIPEKQRDRKRNSHPSWSRQWRREDRLQKHKGASGSDRFSGPDYGIVLRTISLHNGTSMPLMFKNIYGKNHLLHNSSTEIRQETITQLGRQSFQTYFKHCLHTNFARNQF